MLMVFGPLWFPANHFTRHSVRRSPFSGWNVSGVGSAIHSRWRTRTIGSSASRPPETKANQIQPQRQFQAERPETTFFKRPLQRNHSCHGIRRCRSQPSLHRQPLVDFDGDVALCRQFVQHALRDAITGVGGIQRNPRIFICAENLNPTAPPHANPDQVMQSNRLINSAKIVEAISARSTNIEPEINLRKRTDRNSNGRGIVSDLPRLMGRVMSSLMFTVMSRLI